MFSKQHPFLISSVIMTSPTETLLQSSGSNIVEGIVEESFGESDLRYLSQSYDSKVAENFINSLNNRYGNLSKRFVDGLTMWLNVYARPVVPFSNQTNQSEIFALRAEIALDLIPSRRTDMQNPQLSHLKEVCMGHYHLQASNATGPRRLGVRIFERVARVGVIEDSENEKKQRGLKRYD